MFLLGIFFVLSYINELEYVVKPTDTRRWILYFAS
jgi:hypothetical protein